MAESQPQQEQPEEVNWKPLESNPEVMNPYSQQLGFDISRFQFQDLMSLEEWAQESIPTPVKALMLLFPIKESTEQFKQQEQERIQTQGQVVSNNLYYMRQYAINACGSVAVLHALLNLYSEHPELVQQGSLLEKFYNDTKELSPHDRGIYFNKFDELRNLHSTALEANAVSAVQDDVETHFIAFVQRDGNIYELDGRKQFPINHGATTEESFLPDVCKVAQQFMDRDPGEINFTILVLAPPQ